MHYDETVLGHGSLLSELCQGVEGVGGGDSGATVGRAEEGEGEVGPVAEEEDDDVALVDVNVVEVGGDVAGGVMDVGMVREAPESVSMRHGRSWSGGTGLKWGFGA